MGLSLENGGFRRRRAGNVVAIGRHIAVQKKVAIADDTWPLLEVETARLHSVTTDSGTALELAGNGSHARRAVIACKRERARRLHAVALTETGRVRKDRPVGARGQL
jgi:hypothetical protein